MKVRSATYALGTAVLLGSPTTGHAAPPTILHRFASDGSEGSGPFAQLLYWNGTFWGLTSGEGEYNKATVFTYTPSTNSFQYSQLGGTGSVGTDPNGMSGVAFTPIGTGGAATLYAGVGGAVSPDTGSVFGILASLAGSLPTDCIPPYCSQVASWDSSSDAFPNLGLVAIGSTLYGTTQGGGANSSGMLFSVTPGSMFGYDLLYSFPSGADPLAGLTLGPDGNLYGTTEYGGSDNFGTDFQFNPTTNTLTTIWSFSSAYGGNKPASVLTFDSNGNLYGTTTTGNSMS